MTSVIGLDDVLNFYEYEKVRDECRGRVIALKRKRRVAVGPYLSFVFENRETLLFQIQEVCRVERMIDDAKIQEEIGVYRALLPGARTLSATLFIEIADQDQIKLVLDRFMGLDVGSHVWARPPVRRDPSRAVDRPRGLTGARRGARVYCMIQNQT
ncbi:MAG TPA: DUF3501 family protein [Candidatus Dormibacteraeota bacterium]|jgi:hypothetical protein|nr:DUF3501 family protein [Candidatus Dormibacteraeota bacterium]